MKKYIGSRIKKFRDEKGYTQEGLGTLTGISKARICRMENGEVEPDRESVEKMAAVLGKNPEDFYLPAGACYVGGQTLTNSQAVNGSGNTIHPLDKIIFDKYTETLEKLVANLEAADKDRQIKLDRLVGELQEAQTRIAQLEPPLAQSKNKI